VLKAGYFWIPFDWEIMGVGKGLYHYQYVVILPFAVLGMFVLFRKLDKYVFLYIPLVYVFMMSLVFYGSPRFRMPLEPYLIIFAVAGAYKFFGHFKNKYTPAVITGSYALANVLMYLNSDLIKQAMRSVFVLMRIW
jgi:hypothetical protein